MRLGADRRADDRGRPAAGGRRHRGWQRLGPGSATIRRSLFFHAYLVAFTFYLSITLGALFFVMLHHLTRAGWSVTLRRLAEGLSGNIGLMAVLFVPVLLGMGQLYEWARPEAIAAAMPLWRPRRPTSTRPRFCARLLVYFAVWGVLAWYFRSRSIRQDATGDVRLSALDGADLRPGHDRLQPSR